MIFVDTSAIYALISRRDDNHERATVLAQSFFETDTALVTHNYILLEAIALVQNRLGWRAAVSIEAIVSDVDVVWIDAEQHLEAARRWKERGGEVSLVDEVSFLVMRERGIDTAFAFDQYFRREGFKTL
jgi:predicted nucleic acid-binding protein